METGVCTHHKLNQASTTYECYIPDITKKKNKFSNAKKLYPLKKGNYKIEMKMSI